MITIGTIKISKVFYILIGVVICGVILSSVISSLSNDIAAGVFSHKNYFDNEKETNLWLFIIKKTFPYMVSGSSDYIYPSERLFSLPLGFDFGSPLEIIRRQMPFFPKTSNQTMPVITNPSGNIGIEDLYGENTYQGTGFTPEDLEILREKGILIDELLTDPGKQESIEVIPRGDVANPGKPRVLIYHTHITEAYLPTSGNYDIDEWRHSLEMEITVSAVGEVLANTLRSNYGIGVIHDRTIHDYPSAIGSYSRSKNTAQRILRENPSIEIVIDLHRDALGPPPKGDIQFSRDNTTGEVNGVKVAQVLLFLGSKNPGYHNNLRFARQFKEKMDSLYPGLSRNHSGPYGIMTRDGVYNQDISPKAILLEVGSIGNTIEEAKRSAVLLAEVIASLL